MYIPYTVCSDSTYSPSARRGKHKIFIGMAPGVGKTYKMLDEATRLKRDGIDVVIGWLETHGRPETNAKAEGLEVISRKKIEWSGLTFTEMDTDAIIARQPQLVLIDELAHTNVPGADRNRRYLDIEAILAANIDVYSTVNIQHLESLSTQVTQMTGLVVRECIPDSLLEAADQVVVVDVTPETLEERLLEGKIYPTKKIEQSVQNLFQRSNLVVLRELALRQVADNIEKKEIQQAARLNSNSKSVSANVCCIHERILVCVSCEPNSIRLIQRGALLADYMNAQLYVLFVNNPDHLLTKVETLHIEMCKQICQKFKGEFLQLSSHNVVEEIAHVAKLYRITQVILGQTHRSQWQILFRGSLINQLVRSLHHIDIHVISSEK
ncbi:sensor histidine kinase KdpD [Scytonema sp. UIC 10036]|uniref:sensor histidine kinase KdpD n=1 Tax=Scytonema sp. UIC 10036 TaxID=2304196 RepID=UPI0012DAF070|nr:sensor histidine kinase KdpD [Scytonema sp. UIC 10036]MUG98363.1 sensor histidine kinase KdpD [Scytonema sp. UIC 10036]